MTTPIRPLLLEKIPSHARLCRVWGEAYSTNARPFLSLSKEEVLLADHSVDILLVEDNANDEMLALLALNRQRTSKDIHVVRDGAKALEFIFCTGDYVKRRRKNPGVILLDVNLPFVDGIDVLKQIRSDPRTRSIPVVMLTSSSEEGDSVEACMLGINHYIVKPLNFDEFKDIVRHLGNYSLKRNRQPAAEYRTPPTKPLE